MQNTAITILLITACAILLLKNYLIANINSRFAMSNHLSNAFGIYKKMYMYAKHRIKTKEKIPFSAWVKEQQRG